MNEAGAVSQFVRQRLEGYLRDRQSVLPPHTKLLIQLLIHAIREWMGVRDEILKPRDARCMQRMEIYHQVHDWFWSDSDFIGTVWVVTRKRGKEKTSRAGLITFGAICMALDVNPKTIRRLLEARTFGDIEDIYYGVFGTEHRTGATDSASWWDPDSL